MAGGSNAKGPAQGEEMQKVDLTTLSLPQLAQLKQQLEQVKLSSDFALPNLVMFWLVPYW